MRSSAENLAPAQPSPPSAHWAWPLIGLPYRDQASGPDAFDCWGLVEYCLREHAGLVVPGVRLDVPAAFRQVMKDGRYCAGTTEATEVDRPREFDVVFMTCASQPHHVGLWIAPDRIGGVLHAVEGARAAFQRRASLAMHGWTIVKFMRVRAV